MAINSIILEMNAAGQDATLELPDGKWCHSPEYLKRRYGSGIKRQPRPAPVQDAANDLIGIPLKKLTPSERALLLALLEDQ